MRTWTCHFLLNLTENSNPKTLKAELKFCSHVWLESQVVVVEASNYPLFAEIAVTSFFLRL